MEIDWMPLLTFLFVASITPGPNNLTAAAMGMRSGFRRVLPFILGVYFGVAVLLTLTGFLKLAISDFFYRNITLFKILGSAYLLWLAFSLVRKDHGVQNDRDDVSFLKGLALQMVNPKGLFFAMTMFSVFLTGNYGIGGTVILAFGLPLMTILCVSTWAFAGSYLSQYLEDSRHRRIFYWIMALLLVYTVISILTGEFSVH